MHSWMFVKGHIQECGVVWLQIKGSSPKASPQKDNSAAQKLQT